MMCMKYSLPAFSQVRISRSFDGRSLPSSSLVLLWAGSRQAVLLRRPSPQACGACPPAGSRHQHHPGTAPAVHTTSPFRIHAGSQRRGHGLLASLVREMAGAAILWWDLQLFTASRGFISLLGRFLTRLRIHSAYSSGSCIYVHTLEYPGS